MPPPSTHHRGKGRVSRTREEGVAGIALGIPCKTAEMQKRGDLRETGNPMPTRFFMRRGCEEQGTSSGNATGAGLGLTVGGVGGMVGNVFPMGDALRSWKAA